MQKNCQEVQEQLNQLLDEQRYTTDFGDGRESTAEVKVDCFGKPSYAEHLEQCPNCQEYQAALEAMLIGVESASHQQTMEMPELPSNFASRTVAMANSRSYWNRSLAACAAIAAMLFVAALPMLARQYVGHKAQEKVARIQEATSLEMEDVLSLAELDLRYSQLWQATGRRVATLPLDVQRSAVWPKQDNLAGSLLPAVTLMGDTLGNLLRIVPGNSENAKIQGGETGHACPMSPPVVV